MKCVFAATILAATVSAALGQPPEGPVFEAASIKPGDPARAGIGISVLPARIRTINTPLKFCVQVAWNVKDFQVGGAVGWMDTAPFDIDAVAAQPFANEEYRGMLQALLAERFGLEIHRETQEKTGFALVVGRSGPKLPAAIESPDTLFSRTPSGDVAMKATSESMAQLASLLTSALGQIVVDKTGIEGRYDVSLEFAPDAAGPFMRKSGALVTPPPDTAPGPSIFTAVQEKLGLRLEARKVPVEVIVIDHAHPPLGN